MCNIFYDRRYVHIDKRWRRDIFFDVLTSDSITRCSSGRKRRCCGDSAAKWGQHQWKKCKKYISCGEPIPSSLSLSLSVHSFCLILAERSSEREREREWGGGRWDFIRSFTSLWFTNYFIASIIHSTEMCMYHLFLLPLSLDFLSLFSWLFIPFFSPYLSLRLSPSLPLYLSSCLDFVVYFWFLISIYYRCILFYFHFAFILHHFLYLINPFRAKFGSSLSYPLFAK